MCCISMCYISHCNFSVTVMITIMASDITVAEKSLQNDSGVTGLAIPLEMTKFHTTVIKSI
jgi:hypothetical protein